MARTRLTNRSRSRQSPSTPQVPFRGRRRLRGRAQAKIPTASRSTVGINFSVNLLTADEATAVAGNRALSAAWNRQVRNLAAIITRRARELSRPTYLTGLFSSGWDAFARGSGLKLTIRLENRAPYAGFVHRSGERATVVSRYILPMVREEIRRWAGDVGGPLADALAVRLLAELAET